MFLPLILLIWSSDIFSLTPSAAQKLLPTKCTVIRDGQDQRIDTAELVVGDLLKIENGGRVAADCRMLVARELLVDKSSLNGETEPFRLCADASPANTEPIDSHCLAFNGSPICDGQGVGLVIRTGDATFIGTVAQLTNVTRGGETTFEREVKIFVKIISVLAISMAVIFFVVGVARKGGQDAVDLLINGFVVIIVANVPQGIPATVTSLLTVAARLGDFLAGKSSETNQYLYC